MKKWYVFRGENWLGSVVAETHEEAMKEADKNPDFSGYTTVEERGEYSRSGAQ